MSSPTSTWCPKRPAQLVGTLTAMRTADTTGAEAPRDFLDMHRVTPTLLTVTTTRSDQERWVRVLRSDGLVLIALVPLHRHGLVDRAEAVGPPPFNWRSRTATSFSTTGRRWAHNASVLHAEGAGHQPGGGCSGPGVTCRCVDADRHGGAVEADPVRR